ncbi:flagellar protein [Aeromonas australiensis]|uniref:flagellar FliJ family protein n=1 Tax=Aeromonas australiensis TaxID=1114880 RepID=UPI001F25A377|nr:flagellar FliJ family protein [Aeromonas australiensis]MCF3095906.1 flagellar protein [Aeromonas australiensis]
MLEAYLELQQASLEKLGQERQRLREHAQQEELRAHQLQEVIRALHPGATAFHPLLRQNSQQMDDQLRRLLSHQVQQSALARLELARHEEVMIRQFGRVKGLESLLTRRATQQQQAQERRNQYQLDELACQRYLAKRD